MTQRLREMPRRHASRRIQLAAVVAAFALVVAACGSGSTGTEESGSDQGQGSSPESGEPSGGGSASGESTSEGASGNESSGGDSSGEKPVYGGELVIGRSQDSQSMNNVTTFDNRSIFVQEQMMQMLFMVTPDGKATEPLLADSYSVSDDKLTYTIKLKQGIKFSTGEEMTSADVKFSIDQNTKHADDGWGFINTAIKSVDAPDKYTVVIHLKYAWAPLIADLSLFANAIVPKDYGGKTMDEFYKAPVGTGPFMWGEWKHGQYLRLVKNPNYWQDGLPYLDSVKWTVVPDSNTRKLQLLGGQIDIDEYPDWSTFQQLQKSSEVNAVTFPSTQINYLAFNESVKPFQDVHVRRAISAMINRKAIIKAVLFGNGKPANSFLMPGVPFYDPGTPGIMYNPDLAADEMAKSSVPEGFSTTLLIHSGNASELSTAQIIKSGLKKYDIAVQIKQLDPTAAHQAQSNMQYKMTLSAWTMDIPDPDEWTSFAINPTGKSKSAYTGYDSEKAVSLNKQAQTEIDHDKRAKLYSELQKVVAHDAPFATLYYQPYAYGIAKDVHNFHVTPLGNYPLKKVWKSK